MILRCLMREVVRMMMRGIETMSRERVMIGRRGCRGRSYEGRATKTLVWKEKLICFLYVRYPVCSLTYEADTMDFLCLSGLCRHRVAWLMMQQAGVMSEDEKWHCLVQLYFLCCLACGFI